MKALQLLLAIASLSALASCYAPKNKSADSCCGTSTGDCCKDEHPKGKK